VVRFQVITNLRSFSGRSTRCPPARRFSSDDLDDLELYACMLNKKTATCSGFPSHLRILKITKEMVSILAPSRWMMASILLFNMGLLSDHPVDSGLVPSRAVQSEIQLRSRIGLEEVPNLAGCNLDHSSVEHNIRSSCPGDSQG
jgi:hypothetical protein